MELGFNTFCLPDLNLEEIVAFASKNGFKNIEVNCDPVGESGFQHIPVEDMTPEKSGKIIKLLRENNVKISCLGHYSNPFSFENENEFVDFFKKLIDVAHSLGVKNVSTYTGYLAEVSMNDNLSRFKKIFKPLSEYAAKKNVNVLLENVPLPTSDRYGGNFAYSPELWDSIFTLIPDENFGLNYDPSHLFWLGVDYILFLKVFSDRIFHVQAKDSEILIEKLRMTGILGHNWFRYRLPGCGSIEWNKFIPALYEAGYDGVISVEHEDPVWLGSPEIVQRGLKLALKTLKPFVV